MLDQYERMASDISQIPPQNLEAEQSTLGSMMLERTALEDAMAILTSEDFYRPAHQEVFDALAALNRRNEPSDLITLQEELRKRGKLEDIGGTEYLMVLVDSVPTAANLEHYAHIVEKKSILRKLISTGTAIVGMAQHEDSDVREIVEEAERLIFNISQARNTRAVVSIAEAVSDFYGDLESITGNYGIPVSLKPLSDACIGMARSEFTVLGARPMVGKSALALQLLTGAAETGKHKAAIVSCEMSEQQFVIREIAKRSGVSARQMLAGPLHDHHWDKIAVASAETYNLPVEYVDAAGWTTSQIRATCRRLASKGVDIVAVDHMQIVKPDNSKAGRHVQLGQISKDLKDMARTLNIHVLGLCQLNRDIEKRGQNARPTLADLKESGDIEANADNVWLLWREMQKNGPEIEEAEIILAKQRMLESHVVKCGFHGRKFQFVPMTNEYNDAPNRQSQNKETN